MTPETQALVKRLDAWSHDERLGDGMLLRNAAAALTALARENEQHKRLLLDIMVVATMATADAAIVADTFNGQHILDAVTRLARDLEEARQCPDCRQPLVCPAGTAERIAGLEAMHDETLTRAERAEDAVRAAVDREMTARLAVRAARAETDKAVRTFLGWLTGEIPELWGTDVPKLGEAWEKFKRVLAAREGQ